MNNITHSLKIEQNYLSHLRDGSKRCEIRFNDRDYQVGDFLEFHYQAGDQIFKVTFQISHIHSGLGLKENYVALSLRLHFDEQP